MYESCLSHASMAFRWSMSLVFAKHIQVIWLVLSFATPHSSCSRGVDNVRRCIHLQIFSASLYAEECMQSGADALAYVVHFMLPRWRCSRLMPTSTLDLHSTWVPSQPHCGFQLWLMSSHMQSLYMLVWFTICIHISFCCSPLTGFECSTALNRQYMPAVGEKAAACRAKIVKVIVAIMGVHTAMHSFRCICDICMHDISKCRSLFRLRMFSSHSAVH